MQKKIMILGGNSAQQTVTMAAKELGHYVISVDYLPENPAHKYADEYHNVSTLDKDAVLNLAKNLEIDGILTYASDISVSTVSYVANKLSLPTNPENCLQTLTNKSMFREFLRSNGFACPRGKSFALNEKSEAFEFYLNINSPCIVKPVDSSGSKGVHKIQNKNDFFTFFDDAINHSISKKVMVEEFIERVGYQTDGDGFVVDGKIAVFGMMDQHQDKSCSAYTPIAHSYPSTQSKETLEKAKALAQKIFDLLGFNFGAFNYEYIVDKNGKIYILEIGPRNGGNMIADAYKEACLTDMAKCSVQCALGLDPTEFIVNKFCHCATSYVIHSNKSGIFRDIKISDEIADNVKSLRFCVKQGEKIERFKDASGSLAMAVISFDSTEKMHEVIANMPKYIQVKVDNC